MVLILAHSPGWISLLMATAVYLSGFWMCKEGRAGCCSPQAAADSRGTELLHWDQGYQVTRHQLGFNVLWHLTLVILLQSFPGVLGILEGTFLPCGQPLFQVSTLEAQTLLLFLLLVIPVSCNLPYKCGN